MIKTKEKDRREGPGKAKTKDLLDIVMDAAADPAAEVKLTRDNIKAFVLVSTPLICQCAPFLKYATECWIITNH
jgi:hypothetical protein